MHHDAHVPSASNAYACFGGCSGHSAGAPRGWGGLRWRLCAPAMTMAELAVLADYVIVEADGSKRLPLKAHAAHEPVIPPETSRTVCVVGLSGLGRRVAEVVHRPELFAPPESVVTPELLAEVLNREALADIYYLNQTDLCGEATAKKLASLLHRPAVWGSLRRGEVLC